MKMVLIDVGLAVRLIFIIFPIYWIDVEPISSTRRQTFCSDPNQISIIDGNYDRLVTEGSRVIITCCVPGTTNGHDHEQLVWMTPNNKEVINYFSNPVDANKHAVYSVPDFHSKNHLVTMLVIQQFSLNDQGRYTCQKLNFQSTINPVGVNFFVQPRLMADYIPVLPAHLNDSSAPKVQGPAVSVELEIGKVRSLYCRINPNLNADMQVHVTWFFQGQQLIAPALAIKPPNIPSSLHLNNFTAAQSLVDDELTNEKTINVNQGYSNHVNRPIALDPVEVGIEIYDNGQILKINQVDTRHSGIYLCKAEALNPTWSGQSSPYDISSFESGTIKSPMLIQLQTIRGIVYSPPRLLPGNPKEIIPTLHLAPSYSQYDLVNSLNKRNRIRPSPHYLQTKFPISQHNSRPFATHSMHKSKGVVEENGKLVLECQARGIPSPKMFWYRGGMGSPLIGKIQAVTFDQKITAALQHMSLNDIQQELGTLIANSQGLLPGILGSNEPVNVTSNFKLLEDSESFGQDQMEHFQMGRFELTFGLRNDDKGNRVIAVSILTINNLQPVDATRYTCLSLLDLSVYGGQNNFTDVGSILPNIVMKPRFVRSGTNLHVNANIGDNATLSCEAYGGLANPSGLRVRLIRGPGIKKLISQISKPLLDNTLNNYFNSEFETNNLSAVNRNYRAYSTVEASQLKFIDPDSNGNANEMFIKNANYIQVIKNDINPRYHLSVKSDDRNPYATILKLDITDLTPDDNAEYACEALSGPRWRAISPTISEPMGRLTIWFAPPNVEIRDATSSESNDNAIDELFDTKNQDVEHIVYGLSHLPSKLTCQSLGQPPPTWKWYGPHSKQNEPLGESGDDMGYTQVDHQDGEYSISELTIPAGYWNVGVFGTYICVSTNRLGSATGYVRLKLATHPSQPSIKACKVEATLIELCVEPPEENGGLPLTHYELRIQTHPRGAFHGPFAYLPGRRVLRLPNLIPGYYYRFALSAVSKAGRGPNAYLQVTTNRLTKPSIHLLAAQEYIHPTSYKVHWKVQSTDSVNIDQYDINVRPVEVDYSLGDVIERPLGPWFQYTNINPTCYRSIIESGLSNCNFQISDLKPSTAYEFELVGQNSMGFSETQRILFRTSSLSGASGKVLNMPETLRLTGLASNKQFNVHQLIITGAIVITNCIFI